MASATTPAAAGSEQAMNRVLRAEHDARTAVAGCEAQATATVEQARQQARRIADRTDQRISRLHAACELAAAHQVELLLQQEQRSDAGADMPAHEGEVLAAAVERLAARLTGSAAPQPDSECE